MTLDGLRATPGILRSLVAIARPEDIPTWARSRFDKC